MKIEDARAALAAMTPENRELVERINAAGQGQGNFGQHWIEFARVCQANRWPRAWANHVQDVVAAYTDFDNDIPF